MRRARAVFIAAILLLLIILEIPVVSAAHAINDNLENSDYMLSGTFVVTMYTAHDPGMNGRGITASGTKVKEWYTIAVDKKLIPLGSKVYIPELSHLPNGGWFVAEDTGGAIRGRRLDIYVASRHFAKRFGRKQLYVVVYKSKDKNSKSKSKSSR